MSSIEEINELNKEIFNLFNSKISEIIKTVANTSVEILMGDIENDLDFTLLEEQIKLEIKLSGFLDGVLFYVIPKTAVARLADLIMMGDGTSEYEVEHCDAVSEFFNQILKSFIAEVSAQYGFSLSSDGVSASETKLEEYDLNPDGISFVSGTIKMEGFDDFDYKIVYESQIFQQALEEVSNNYQGENHDSQTSINDVLSQFEFDSQSSEETPEMVDFKKEDIKQATKDLENIYDISLDVSIELGRTKMSIRKILGLTTGSIIELDKLAGEPVDILVNQKPIAKGEVVVIDESFGVRLTTLLSPEDRIKNLG